MAKNLIREDGYHLSVVCSDPATPTSGAPVRWGPATGVAQTDEADGTGGVQGGQNPSGYTSVDFGQRVWSLPVKGVDDNGNSAVAIGDPLFYVDSDTPALSKKASGYFFGIAKMTVGSGSIATIDVLHIPSPGSGSLGAGVVGATQLANSGVTTIKIASNAVTAAKLTSTLATGYIPLPLAQARLIATNDIAAKNAADGGLISLDTDPTFKRVNGATDPQLRIAWAATSVIPIQWGFDYPPDLDDTANVIVHLLAGMGGATDTPVLGVAYWEGVGSSSVGGNTAALAATVADVTRTITGASIGAYPKSATVIVTPPSHGTDAIYLYGAHIEYTRK